MPIDFIPQEGITNSILNAIGLANQHSQALATQQIQQQNAATAAQEADTATRRLAVETPYIQPQTQGQLTSNQKAAQQLAQNEFATDYLNGNSGHGSEAHIAGVVGANGHYGVPAEAPAPVTPTVSNLIPRRLLTSSTLRSHLARISLNLQLPQPLVQEPPQ